MHIKKLAIKTFRCFDSFDITFNAPFILISGSNGSGKTTLLEILHYGCYLKSFRTHIVHDLFSFDAPSFFIKMTIQDNESFEHDISIGVQDKKKLVKIDQKNVTTYKELTQLYRIVTLTEDDLFLVKGSPEIRRTWIDQACSLINSDYIKLSRNYRKILTQRNALLQTYYTKDSYDLWTDRLCTASQYIQNERTRVLSILQTYVNDLLSTYFPSECTVTLSYKAKTIAKDDQFKQEQIMKRSLIGAHLDDIVIDFQKSNARSFASRGQQKLITLLLKIAEIKHLTSQGLDAVLLLDDFMTDFDQERIDVLLGLLQQLNTQIIFTSPLFKGYLENKLLKLGAQHITLKS